MPAVRKTSQGSVSFHTHISQNSVVAKLFKNITEFLFSVNMLKDIAKCFYSLIIYNTEKLLRKKKGREEGRGRERTGEDGSGGKGREGDGKGGEGKGVEVLKFRYCRKWKESPN